MLLMASLQNTAYEVLIVNWGMSENIQKWEMFFFGKFVVEHIM
jgi:hypothetical protein